MIPVYRTAEVVVADAYSCNRYLNIIRNVLPVIRKHRPSPSLGANDVTDPTKLSRACCWRSELWIETTLYNHVSAAASW